VIEMRFGLAGRQPGTLHEIAGTFGVTAERVRQLESCMPRKPGSLPRAPDLRDVV
jgi:DNA-directed RNA polymerase sigma subunit (sigma70/sigma32)